MVLFQKQLNDWTEDMNNVLKAKPSDTNNVLVGFVDNLEKAIDTSNRASIEFNKEYTQVKMSDAANSLGSNIKSLNK